MDVPLTAAPLPPAPAGPAPPPPRSSSGSPLARPRRAQARGRPERRARASGRGQRARERAEGGAGGGRRSWAGARLPRRVLERPQPGEELVAPTGRDVPLVEHRELIPHRDEPPPLGVARCDLGEPGP